MPDERNPAYRHHDAAVDAALELVATHALERPSREAAERLVEELACHVEELVIAELRRKGVIPQDD